jgi:hypothetical protein
MTLRVVFAEMVATADFAETRAMRPSVDLRKMRELCNNNSKQTINNNNNNGFNNLFFLEQVRSVVVLQFQRGWQRVSAFALTGAGVLQTAELVEADSSDDGWT